MKDSYKFQDRSTEVKYFREQYRPERHNIKLLLIEESPPHSGNDEILHFFYNPYYNKNDNLYKAISDVIFPNVMNKKDGVISNKIIKGGSLNFNTVEKQHHQTG